MEQPEGREVSKTVSASGNDTPAAAASAARTIQEELIPGDSHAAITAPGYHGCVTHLFQKGDEFIETDVVYGVKEPLIVEFVKKPPGKSSTGEMVSMPFYEVKYDFVLQKQVAALAARDRNTHPLQWKPGPVFGVADAEERLWDRKCLLHVSLPSVVTRGVTPAAVTRTRRRPSDIAGLRQKQLGNRYGSRPSQPIFFQTRLKAKSRSGIPRSRSRSTSRARTQAVGGSMGCGGGAT